MITIEHLKKSYGNLTVYDDFSLDIPEGKITCLLGESGCGKTTLLNILAGLTPYEGKVTPLRCSYVFQQPRLVPNLTVLGNLRLVCKEQKRCEEMLKRVGLTDKANQYPNKLSGGQAQRVSLARALLYDADVILLDEPFSSLDLKLKITLMELVRTLLCEHGKTAVFVTHDVDEALYLSDNIILLEKGRCKDRCSVAESEREFGKNSILRERLLSAILQ